MESFEIAGASGNYIKILLIKIFGFPEDTFHWGGYDAKAEIKINVGAFGVNSEIYISTADIFVFYKELLKCNEELSGRASLKNYENNLTINFMYATNGQIVISGNSHTIGAESGNELNFEYQSDQSYMQATLKQLQAISEIYGNEKGALK